MNLNDLITTIEKMEADLCALKLKARAIQPAIDALAGLADLPTGRPVRHIDNLQHGDALMCTEEITTYNGMTIPANTRMLVTDIDGTGVPLRVRWLRDDGNSQVDWLRVSKPDDRRGIDLSKTHKVC